MLVLMYFYQLRAVAFFKHFSVINSLHWCEDWTEAEKVVLMVGVCYELGVGSGVCVCFAKGTDLQDCVLFG